MSTLSPAASALSPVGVLADAFNPARSLIRNVALVFSGACAVGALAQVSIPMWPVPITGQTLGVMLVGAILGARRGASSLATYAGLGLLGIPWFANFGGGLSYALKPSFGFIVGFIVTAWVMGSLCERRWDRRMGGALVAFGAASLIPFAIGVPWMWANLHFYLGKSLTFAETMYVGFVPFIPGGIVKWLLGAALVRAAWALWGKPSR